MAGAMAPPQATALPAEFTETTVLTGLEFPTALRFAPGGQLFVAEKSGLIKVFDSVTDPEPAIAADLRTDVYNHYERGLLGIALDPDFSANRYLYALYTRNAKIGGTAPFWPELDETNDDCPGPTQPPTEAAPG
jgi:glucose/arabinose dehydrogenase